MFFLFSIINVVNASDSLYIGIMDDTLRGNECITDKHFLTHSTGKSIYVYAVSKHMRVVIIDVDGSIEADFDLYVNDDAYVGKLNGYSLLELDEDEVILFATVDSGASPWYNRGMVSRINMNTYAHNEYYHNRIGDTTTGLQNARLSNVVENDDMFYCAALHMGNANGDFSLMMFNPSTNSLTEPIENTALIPYSTTYIQNPFLTVVTPDDVILWNFEDAAETATTYHLNLNTNTMTHLADAPIGGKINYNPYVDFIADGYETVNVTGDTHYYIYLVYTSSYNPFDSPSFDAIYFRQIYNNSFTVGNLIGNKITAVAFSPNEFHPSYNEPWSIGAIKQNSLTEFYCWYLYYEYYDYPLTYHSIHKATFTLGNNTDEAFYDITTDLGLDNDIEEYSTNIDWNHYDDLIYKEEASTYQVLIEYTGDCSQWVYYQQAPLQDYFTMTKSYSPLDVPLIQSKFYTFTYTFKNNGIPYFGGIVLIYVDDTLVTSKVTDSNGKVIVNMSFSSIGYHTVKIELYKSMMELSANYEDETIYLVVQPTVTPEYPDYDILGDTLINVLVDNLPIFVVVLLPAFAGGKKAGTMGYILGFCVGVAIAVQATLLPIYYAYLLALAVIMGLIFVLRGGGSQ